MRIDLSNSEWKLMRCLWDQAPRTITELTAALREETGWSKNTVITMLARLEAKGAVRHYPALRREDAVRDETESFLSKVYGGSLGLMMSAMVESRRLSEEDISELAAILDKAGGEAR